MLISGRGLSIAMAALLCSGTWAAPASALDADPDLDFARRLNNAFVRVAETVSPSVVVVQVRSRGSRRVAEHEELLKMLPEELREDFLEGLNRRRTEQGSGVILREDGHILTNAHVVEDAEEIEIRLQDGRRFPATVKGVDTESDLAVVRVEATGLPAARLGDSDAARVGEFAIAIGAPFEFEYSVTFGHISGKGRRVTPDTVMMDQDFIQTDASINPGNSGGPLVNLEGEVVGINSMIQGLNTGIGFAIPINLAREVAEQLIERGRFARAWLGINIQSVREERREGGTPVEREGVRVVRILENGPSWNSDLRRNDIIVAIEGKPVRSEAELKRLVSRRPAGEPMKVGVIRGTERLELSLKPGELPQDRWAFARAARERGHGATETETKKGGEAPGSEAPESD